jgi:hypothetical protein
MDNNSSLAVHKRFFNEKDQLSAEKTSESLAPPNACVEGSEQRKTTKVIYILFG